MAYTRKTKDIFVLMWNGEEIDTAENYKEKNELVKEYNLAYGGGVTAKLTRVKLEA